MTIGHKVIRKKDERQIQNVTDEDKEKDERQIQNVTDEDKEKEEDKDKRQKKNTNA